MEKEKQTKQTAVEWLHENNKVVAYMILDNKVSQGIIDQLFNCFATNLERAKEMEKQQTFEDFRRGLDISIQEAYRIAQKSWAREHRTQQYYNETYGK